MFPLIFITNNIKYRYYFSADVNKIYTEILDAYYSQKPTNIFTRTNTNIYDFNIDKSKLESLKSKNTDNKLFLSTATTWNYDKTKDAYLWFAEKIDTYNLLSIQNNQYLEYLDKNKERPKTKEFLLSMLKHAEINIQDYE